MSSRWSNGSSEPTERSVRFARHKNSLALSSKMNTFLTSRAHLSSASKGASGRSARLAASWVSCVAAAGAGAVGNFFALCTCFSEACDLLKFNYTRTRGAL